MNIFQYIHTAFSKLSCPACHHSIQLHSSDRAHCCKYVVRKPKLERNIWRESSSMCYCSEWWGSIVTHYRLLKQMQESETQKALRELTEATQDT